jgi:ABC-type multidrug transport system fused ATPase/permease subunit
MVIEELKENFVALDDDVRSYIEQNREYYQLKAFKIAMKGITSLTQMLFIGAIAILTVLLLAITVAIGIGQVMDNLFYGFLIVGLFFVVVSIMLYIFRDKIDRPVLRKFSEYYFDEL